MTIERTFPRVVNSWKHNIFRMMFAFTHNNPKLGTSDTYLIVDTTAGSVPGPHATIVDYLYSPVCQGARTEHNVIRLVLEHII